MLHLFHRRWCHNLKEISPYLSSILDDRRDVLEKNKISISLNSSVPSIETSFLVKTLIINGDSTGLVIFLSNDISNMDLNLVDVVLNYLEKELE